MEITDFKKILWEYTRKITDNTNIAFNPICEQHGLTMIQVRILVEVHNQVSHTIGGLAKRIHMAGTNISTMCKKLENMGYLERVRDQNDERVVKVILTRKGNEVVISIDKDLNERISSYICDEKSLESIIVGLQKLNELLEKMGNTNK